MKIDLPSCRSYEMKTICKWFSDGNCKLNIENHKAPCENIKITDELIEQYRWERDVAISQLAEIGKGFGAKMDDVKEALIKQEPKKVIQHGEEGDDLCWFECPECGFYVTGCWKDEALAYCSECGQAMDWGSEDDY